MWYRAPEAIRKLCSGQNPKNYAALGYCVTSVPNSTGGTHSSLPPRYGAG